METKITVKTKKIMKKALTRNLHTNILCGKITVSKVKLSYNEILVTCKILGTVSFFEMQYCRRRIIYMLNAYFNINSGSVQVVYKW